MLCYNVVTGENTPKERLVKNMNANLEYNLMNKRANRVEIFRTEKENKTMESREENRRIDNCECSAFSMAAVAGSVLMGIGIVLYGLITAII